MDIVWLGSPHAHDPCRVGGKAANLSRLAACNPVPPGFCLTTGSPLVLGCDADSTGHSAPHLSGRRTPGALQGSAAWAELLSQAYLALGERCCGFPPAVAVRSSAVDEDGQRASFAGQYESYLNICGLEGLLAAVRRCLSAARSERVQRYRHMLLGPVETSGISEAGFVPRQAGPAIAVLVQQFVRADISAVVFSVDPIGGGKDCVTINAAWGLGESLVAGRVTPDLFVARKSDGVLLAGRVADKACMSIPALNGTRCVAVPRPMRRQPALNDVQIAALVALACRLETQMGWPVDLECSFVGKKLYLLQCRPVTALKPEMVAL
ncbi:MAG: PEP/pyruvate-binding domain-containing protein [Chloroflexota bacterium]